MGGDRLDRSVIWTELGQSWNLTVSQTDDIDCDVYFFLSIIMYNNKPRRRYLHISCLSLTWTMDLLPSWFLCTRIRPVCLCNGVIICMLGFERRRLGPWSLNEDGDGRWHEAPWGRQVSTSHLTVILCYCPVNFSNSGERRENCEMGEIQQTPLFIATHNSFTFFKMFFWMLYISVRIKNK